MIFFGDLLIKVDKEKNVLWTYNFTTYGEGNPYLTRIKSARDGCFYGMGSWFDSSKEDFDFVLNNAPLICKMNTYGEMIWQKALVRKDAVLFNTAVYGFFNDVVELDNGDLIAVDMWNDNPFNVPRKKLAVRLDSEGCVLGECVEYYTFTDVKDLIITDDLSIDSNPIVDSDLNVRGLLASSRYDYLIYDDMGCRVRKGNLNSSNAKVDIDDLSIGSYIILIQDEDHRYKTLKFVKM